MDINQLCTAFEAYLLTERRVSRNTIDAYNNDMQQFIVFFNQKSWSITSITGTDLKQFVHYLYNLKLSSRSISRKISTLKTFFLYLYTNYAIKNSAKDLCFPSVEQKLPTYLSEEEVKLILTTAEQDASLHGMRNTIMLYLLYVSGMRVSELVALKVTDFHFDTGFVSVLGKGGRERMIPLPSAITDLLIVYIRSIHNRPYLFSVTYGKKIKPLSRQSCWIILKKLCLQAGIQKSVSPHQLRHSFATHMLKKGADLRSLQELLGHESIATVQIYTHVETSQLRSLYDKKHPRS
jgi:integrase/recombinase XerD